VIGRLRARLDRVIDVEHILVAVGVWVLLTVASIAIVLRVVLALPADHFTVESAARPGWTLARVGRNLAGLALIVVGAALSVPGVPGQGVLTMLAGVLLVDFPRRRRVERALFGRPGVLSRLNRLRARFGRPPLLPPRA
jgi:hypothetical protein